MSAPFAECTLTLPVMCAADGLQSLGNSLGLGLQPSLAPTSPLDRGYRAPSASNHSLAQISAAQLLPSFCQSLYASNPGAMLGSGQAAGMALGSSQSQNPLSAGLDASNSNLGAAKYLAGLGLGISVSSTMPCLINYVLHDQILNML